MKAKHSYACHAECAPLLVLLRGASFVLLGWSSYLFDSDSQYTHHANCADTNPFLPLLASLCSYVSNSQWLWIVADAVIVVSFSYTLSLARPRAVLSPHRPTAEPLGPQTVASVCLMLLVDALVLILALVWLTSEVRTCVYSWIGLLKSLRTFFCSNPFRTFFWWRKARNCALSAHAVTRLAHLGGACACVRLSEKDLHRPDS